MNKKQLIQRCLISDDAIETYPFGQDVYKDTCVIRHKSNDKWFALIFYLDKKLYINVKTEPEIGALLRMQYPSITHGWHMNKKHWITVVPGEDISESLLAELIDDSWNQVVNKLAKKDRLRLRPAGFSG